MSMEVGYDKPGLPIGHQFIGKPGAEATVSHLAFAMQELDGRSLTVNKAAPRGSPRPERPPRAFDSGLRIYVGNLPWEFDNVRLEQLFSEHSKVESARIVYDRETRRNCPRPIRVGI